MNDMSTDSSGAQAASWTDLNNESDIEMGTTLANTIFGDEDVANVINQVAETYDVTVEKVEDEAVSNMRSQLSNDLIEAIENSSLDPVMKQEITDALKGEEARTGGSPDNDLAAEVEKQLGPTIDDLSAMIVKDIIQKIMELTEEQMKPDGRKTGDSNKGDSGPTAGAGGSGKADGAGNTGPEGSTGTESTGDTENTGINESVDTGGASGSSGNWLIDLAMALGKIAGEQLEKQVEAGKELSGMGGEGNEGEFAEKNAEMQAAAQMFKIAMEALATITKTTGEAMSSVARK